MTKVVHHEVDQQLPAPAAPRQLRLLCLLVSSASGKPRSLPVHTLRALPPLACVSARWSVVLPVGFVLRETRAFTSSAEVLARCAGHRQASGRTGRRVRKKGFLTKSAAQRYELDFFAAMKNTGRPIDDRLADLVNVWQELHGCTLKDNKYRLSRTLALVERMGNPRASEFDALAWARYRQSRLKDVTAHTINHEQRYLSAVFAELIRLGAWHGDNPLANVRQIKTDQTELSFLTLPQIQELLEECRKSMNTHTYPVALVCVATGCRWDEAESLERKAVYGGKAHFHRTKNRQSRSVPIPPDVEALVLKLGMPGNGRLFMSCRAAFRGAYERCGFNTPGQLTHILRHSFASHYMMAGGDILGLQRILGHASITMTMRYAHMSPDHLESALRLSPLAQSGHVTS